MGSLGSQRQVVAPALQGILFSASLIFGTCAQAHWEWTKWGMTPKEVVAASSGKARAIKPKEVHPDLDLHQMPYDLQAVARHQMGDLVVDVEFLFDLNTNPRRLKCVVLRRPRPSKADSAVPDVNAVYAQLEKHLIAQHGNPTHLVDKPERQRFWGRNSTTGDSIELRMAKSVIFVSYCD